MRYFRFRWYTIWWLVCIGALVFASWQGSHIFTQRIDNSVWQLPKSHRDVQNHLLAHLRGLELQYNRGEIPNLDALAALVRQHPLVKEVRFTQALDGIQLQYTPFDPFAVLNKRFYVNASGEIKTLLPDYAYNPQLQVIIDQKQLKQYLPSIRQLTDKIQSEGLEPKSIGIAQSGMWTIHITNGWTLFFGPNPDFDQLFDTLRQALPQILQRGWPITLDFRYDRAVAVTFAS